MLELSRNRDTILRMSRTLSRHTLITELQDLLCNVATAHASTVEPPESWLEAELTMPQVKAMLVLYHRGSVRIGSVARELCMSKNAATVLLDRLEARYRATLAWSIANRFVVLAGAVVLAL